MEYNTSRSLLGMREYGRSVQKMVSHVRSIQDPVKRNEQALALINVMGILNPSLKNNVDFKHILWDHLFFIADFDLDIDSPYEKPQRETYKAKPDALPYPKRYPKYNHLGKNLEQVIDKALTEGNEEKRSGFAHTVAYYMKLSYSTWHNELMHDENIRSELSAITKGQLAFSNTPYIKHRNQVEGRDGGSYGRGNNNGRNGGGYGNNRNKNNKNRHKGNFNNKKNRY
jgi:hypothetical protein